MAARRASIRRLANVALLAALALVLSYLETMIPLPVAVPGVKLGLANVAVVVALFALDARSALAVAVVKVVASGLLFGSPMMLAYSLGGTTLAFLGMFALTRIPGVGVVLVSMVAALLHNVGQVAVAAALLSSSSVFLTLPVLGVAALVTGALTGAVASGVLATVQRGEDARPHVDASQLELRPGEHVAFVGANGSGKTSCALQLAGLAGEEAGSSERVAGAGSGGRAGAAAERVSTPGAVGVAFQDPDDQIVAPIVRDDVAFGLENRGMPRAQMQAEVTSALEEAGAAAWACRDVASLSGGQKQRVATAGLLAMKPGLAIFDETTSMLDDPARRAFAGVVRRLCARGMGVITITQHMDEAFEADRIVVFADGAIAAQGTPAELLGQGELLAACGLELPHVARLAQALRAAGVDVPLTNDERELEDALCAVHGCERAAAAGGRTAGGAAQVAMAGECAVGGAAGVAGAAAAKNDAAGHGRSAFSESCEGGASLKCGSEGKNAEFRVAEPLGAHSDRPGTAPDGLLGSTGPQERFAGPQRGPQNSEKAAPSQHGAVRFASQAAGGDVPRAAAAACGQLACAGAAFAYGAGRQPVLQDVTLALRPGQLVGLAGASGCGKTTLLRLLAGRLTPMVGSVQLDGLESDGTPQVQRAFTRQVGLVQQLPERQLFAKTVWEDVAFGPRNLGLSDAEVDARVSEALAAVGLDAQRVRETSPFALSGGEQRRVCLAGTLAMRPAYLLLDEPTAGLDPQQRDALMELLARRAQAGCAVLVVSHDLDALAEHVQRLALMGGGTLLYDGPAAPALADADLLARAGLRQPLAARMAGRLQARGVLSRGLAAPQPTAGTGPAATQPTAGTAVAAAAGGAAACGESPASADALAGSRAAGPDVGRGRDGAGTSGGVCEPTAAADGSQVAALRSAAPIVSSQALVAALAPEGSADVPGPATPGSAVSEPAGPAAAPASGEAIRP